MGKIIFYLFDKKLNWTLVDISWKDEYDPLY